VRWKAGEVPAAMTASTTITTDPWAI
jgi:hypothetical protein